MFLSFILLECSNSKNQQHVFTGDYFNEIRSAELKLCKSEFNIAVDSYNLAFKMIYKPFGKDVFNAMLAAQLSERFVERDTFLQILVNNLTDYSFIKTNFVDKYIDKEKWNKLVENRVVEYDERMRDEFIEILERDQLFRPMYDTYDDTITINRKYNLARILSITDSIGFPSHIELGYTTSLRIQNHYIVLLHTAQRRSRDKSIYELDDLLYDAVLDKRFDPEKAIFYMNFQNDLDKGVFEVYSTLQYYHYKLPDSLNNKIWIASLSEEQKNVANKKRKEWNANSLEEIAIKSSYLTKNSLPFIFTSVNKSIMNFPSDISKEFALEQYNLIVDGQVEY
jgi:hypothetical protein